MSPRIRLIADRWLETVVAGFVRSGPMDDRRMRQLSEQIYTRFLRGKAFAEAVELYLSLCLTIDGIKQRTIGLRSLTGKSNMLMQYICEILASNLDATPAQVQELDVLVQRYRDGQGMDSWLHAKAFFLHHSMEQVFQIRMFARGLKINAGSEIFDACQRAIPDFNQAIAMMMSELERLRRYGVKPCFFQDGMLHTPSDAWVYLDFNDAVRAAPGFEKHMLRQQLAVVSLSARDQIRSLDVSSKSIDSRDGASHITVAMLGFGGRFYWSLDDQGELDASGGLGLIRVRDLFQREGRELEYDLVRVTQIMRLFDLVVPIEAVRQLPRLSSPGLPSRILRPGSRLLTPELILPRVRLLERPDIVREDLEREVERAETETIRRCKRRHGVVGHVRDLPEGHHPSARARQLAREEMDGYELADNETYVKKHERGSGDPIPPHRAVRRGSRRRPR